MLLYVSIQIVNEIREMWQNCKQKTIIYGTFLCLEINCLCYKQADCWHWKTDAGLSSYLTIKGSLM